MINITYNEKNKINDLYLHDFVIRNFIYDDIEKNIVIKATNLYLKKQACFNFINILFCEIIKEEKYGDSSDIIDWYALEDTKRFIDNQQKIRPVGIMLKKASRDTIKIYCERIEFEEKKI